MPWKSRIGKDPPALFFAQAAAQMARAHHVEVTREVMETLRPYLSEAWREGANAKKAVDTTCSCDGKAIFPSPSVAVRLLKGEVRPPQGAQRGEVFGANELRLSVDLTRLSQQVTLAQKRVEQATERAEKAEAQEQKARSAESRARVATRLYQALAQKRDALAQLAHLEKKIGAFIEAQARERQRQDQALAAERKAAAPPAGPTQTTSPRQQSAASEAPKAAPNAEEAKPAPARKKAAKSTGLKAPPSALARAVAKLDTPEGL